MSVDHQRLERARAMWRYVGEDRPPFADVPGPGQESVWDYPRPPRLAIDAREVRVLAGGASAGQAEPLEIACSIRSLRVLETASPPTFYLPAADVHTEWLVPAAGHSHCEWKGDAQYWSVHAGAIRLEAVAWSYPRPLPPYEALVDHFAFYPQQLVCLVDGVRARPQPGRFYAGWITQELAGPFKGEPDSSGW
ncbi:MAG: DUF427 domain-containing protein [Variovorax sp.]